MTEHGGTPLHGELSDSVAHDPDENPSVGRAAGWALSGWADVGLVGAVWGALVAIWARSRHQRRTRSRQ